MDLLLTDQERMRFAAWLEHDAATTQGIVEQMEKLGPHTAPMVARQKMEAAAALFIARKLRETHSDSARLDPADPTACKWTRDEDGNWETGCGGMYVLIDGAPADNRMAFCCYCGKPLAGPNRLF